MQSAKSAAPKLHGDGNGLTIDDLSIRNRVIHRMICMVHDCEYVAMDDRFVRDFARHGGRWWKAPYHHGGAREWVRQDVAFNERATLYLPR